MRLSPFFFALVVVSSFACGEPQVEGSPDSGLPPVEGGGKDGGTGTSSQLLKNGSRLKVKVWKGLDGAQAQLNLGLFAAPVFFDSARNEDCAPSLASDGKLRCLPLSVFSTSSTNAVYAEPTCSERLLVRREAVEACVLDKEQRYFQEFSTVTGNCYGTSSTRLFAPGAEHTGAVYEQGGSGCAAITPPGGTRYFRKGMEIPPTEFVEFSSGLLE